MNTMKTWLDQQKEQSEAMLTLLTFAQQEAYTLIDPPYFVYYDQFREQNEHYDPKRSIKMTNPLGHVLVLRPDLTTSVMERLRWHKTDGALKLCYYASTFAQGKERLEVRKEFGLEYFNAPHIEGEITILKTLESLMQALHMEVTLEVGHAGFMKKLWTLLALNKAQTKTLRTLIKHKQSDRLAAFAQTLNTHQHQPLIEALLTLEGSTEKVRATLQSLGYETLFETELKAVEALEASTNLPFILDFSLLSDLEYYAGIMFKAYRQEDARPLIRGGRYQVELLEGQAVGFSFSMAHLLGGEDDV